MKAFKLLGLAVSLMLVQAVAEPINVDVNLNVNHVLGEVTNFEREKFITIHSNIDHRDWYDDYAFTDDLIDDFLNGYDVYMGRNTGGVQWTMWYSVNQDASRPGYADVSHIESLGASSRSSYANNTAYHAYEDRNNMVLCTQLHPFFPDGSTMNSGWSFSQADTESEPLGTASGEFYAHYIKNFFGTGGSTGHPAPPYIEITNEPLWDLYNEIDDAFKFHATVAKEIKKVNPDAVVAGYCTAFPNLEEDNFQRWENRWKKFMDECGAEMDAWSIHLYDFPSIGGKKILRRGSNVEATLDMLEQYSLMKFGKVKPFVISEFGASCHDCEGHWTAESDYYHNTAANALVMQFMERANNIGTTVNYTMMKAEWGSPNVNNVWGSRLLRYANEPTSFSGGWVYTDFVHFYQLWSDVNGVRVDSKPHNLDIMTDAYVDGSVAYVVLNNLSWEDQEIQVNLFETKGLNISALEVKDYRQVAASVSDRGGSIETTTYNTASIPETISIGAEGTVILKYTYSGNLTIDETSTEVKHYATDYYQPISANIAMTFNINGVQKGTYGEAVLRLGLGRDHGKSLTPVVTVNGTQVTVPTNYRGDTQDDRDTYFGVIEIDVPYSLIQENNTVSLTFPDAGGFVSTVTMQSFAMTSEIGREGKGPVSGVEVSPDDYVLSPNGSVQLTADVMPALAENKVVIWTASNSLATVTNGLVQAGATNGTVVVYATTDEGGFVDSCVITIEENLAASFAVDNTDKYRTTIYQEGGEIEVIIDYFAGSNNVVTDKYGGIEVLFRHLDSNWGVVQDYLFYDASVIGTQSGQSKVTIDLDGITPSAELENGEFYFIFPRMETSDGEGYTISGLSPINIVVAPTAVEGVESSSIDAIPNPASESIHFDLEGIYELTLYNAIGQLVLNQIITGNEPVDISFLSTGICYYKLKNNELNYSGVLVVE